MQVFGISEPVPTARLPELYRHGATEPMPTETRPSRRALGGELVWDDQLEVRRGDTAVPLTVWASPFRDPQGRVEYAIVAFQDISDAKRAAAERARLEERVRQAQKMESIGRLASGVAHDFNNLLVPIQAYSSIAARAARRSDVADALAHVQAAAEQAAGLTRNLLAFARKQVLNMSALSLSDELASSARLLESMVPANVQLVRELAPELPNILADRAQLRQVLLNLVVNACQAMPRGGRLLISTRRVDLLGPLSGAHDMQEIPAGSYVVLTVADTGEGMDEPTRARVFEPFFTTKASGQGTGLGLAMVSGIVEQHRGYIRLRSAPGEGTTFEVWFPSLPAG
jgi:signal transduction histidine kinase